MKQYDYKTISRTMLGDLHTPVSTYLKVRDIFPQSALMESSDYHGSENNRSFIALCPLASVSIDHGTAIFRLPDDSREEHPITDAYPGGKCLERFPRPLPRGGRIQQLLRTLRIHLLQCCPLLREYPREGQPRSYQRCAGHAVHII